MYNVLVDNQHGFRAKRSTTTQLVLTIHDITKALEQGKSVHVAFLDFAKAFDKVPHERLLRKLESYGITGSLLKWERHFLTGRTQTVLVNGSSSEEMPVRSGVPQGTVTGPLDFLMYINDLPDGLSSTTRLFADDCVLYTSGTTPKDFQGLQEDLVKLEEWQDRWAMSFNPAKCVIMKLPSQGAQSNVEKVYTFCGQALQEVSTYPYLGVEIDNRLRWDAHINKVCSKASRVLGFLRRNFWTAPKEVKHLSYQTLVRPILEYASPAWDPHFKKDVQRIEAIQRRAARFCTGNFKQTSSVTSMLKELNWESLEERRKNSRLCLMFQVIKGLVAVNPNGLIHVTSRPTRGNSIKLLQQLIKRDVHKFSFFPRTSRDWNELNLDTLSINSLNSFKMKLTKKAQ